MTRALGIDVGASGVRAKIVDAIEIVTSLLCPSQVTAES